MPKQRQIETALFLIIMNRSPLSLFQVPLYDDESAFAGSKLKLFGSGFARKLGKLVIRAKNEVFAVQAHNAAAHTVLSAQNVSLCASSEFHGRRFRPRIVYRKKYIPQNTQKSARSSALEQADQLLFISFYSAHFFRYSGTHSDTYLFAYFLRAAFSAEAWTVRFGQSGNASHPIFVSVS